MIRHMDVQHSIVQHTKCVDIDTSSKAQEKTATSLHCLAVWIRRKRHRFQRKIRHRYHTNPRHCPRHLAMVSGLSSTLAQLATTIYISHILHLMVVSAAVSFAI